MKILSEIPTERAMKELSQTGVKIPSVRQALETMAISKPALIKSLRLMRFREMLLKRKIEMLTASANSDKIISKMLEENGTDYDIVFK